MDRKAVSPLVKLPINEITAILKDLAKCEGKKGWRLKVAPDKEFLERFTVFLLATIEIYTKYINYIYCFINSIGILK